MESCVSALEKPAAELTVMDVYDIAAVLGQEFERIIDQFGCEALLQLMPKVVRVLELLETLVSRGAASQEAEQLRGELDRLRRERSDRSEQERRHQKDLELVEDVWRGEAQDLLSQITQLQAENKRLLTSLALKDSPVTQEDLEKQEGMSEKERQVMKKLKEMVDKQRDEIRAKDHELTLRNEDVEALQMQQLRLMKINQDLRHRIGVMETQGKALIQQRAELEAAAQARLQELGSLQREVARLREERREAGEVARLREERREAARLREDRHQGELERDAANTEKSASLIKSGTSLHTSAQTASLVAEPADPCKQNSVWVECGGDSGFLADCFASSADGGSDGEVNKEDGDQDEDVAVLLLGLGDEEPEEETGSLEQELDKPRFTLQELRDVLHEKNELKAQVFTLQEELAYYRSEDLEDDIFSAACIPSPLPSAPPAEQSESGIRRLIFTAIMPMVAAGLIHDDPTLLPIRRLISFSFPPTLKAGTHQPNFKGLAATKADCCVASLFRGQNLNHTAMTTAGGQLPRIAACSPGVTCGRPCINCFFRSKSHRNVCNQ